MYIYIYIINNNVITVCVYIYIYIKSIFSGSDTFQSFLAQASPPANGDYS